MVTIHREGGFRFEIYSDDHGPAHVHVAGGGAAKIEIDGAAPKLVRTRGYSGSDVRRALRIVAERQIEFLERWRDLHG